MKELWLIFVFVFFVFAPSVAQNVIWSGVSDSDFFNEANWTIEGTQNSPPAGSIDHNADIDFDLVINARQFVLPANSSLSFLNGKGLTLNNSSLDFGALETGYIKLTGKTTLTLQSGIPLGNHATLRLDDNHSWVKLIKVGASHATLDYLQRITSRGNPVTADSDILINQYYYKGSLIRLKDPAFSALTLYDGPGQTGESFNIVPKQIYSRNQLGLFDNRASSFRLERGYQVVVAVFQNGTGKSETYIASEEALEIDLPVALNNTISFVRVMPWNWVTKKGASKFWDVGNTWTYNWNNNSASLPEMEYAPMSWGTNGATLTAVAGYIEMQKVTHVLGFNESDNCSGQSGQYNNLCDLNVAVPLFQNLMRTGLRLVSPSPRENGPFTWMKDFRNLALQKDVRYDVLGVHWYDWGSNPANTPFEDPVKIFNRFKTYLTNVYAEHKMPIWITEFNANMNRDISVQRAFLELALPYLESLAYVERYDYFIEVNNMTRTDIEYALFFDTEGNITPFGEFYRDFESTPAVPSATYAGSRLLADLDKKILLKMEANKTTLNEGEMMSLIFTTERPVAAVENFTIQLDLEDEQFTLSEVNVSIPEGGSTAEVTLTAVDDQLVEGILNGRISLTILSSGIEWDNDEIDITFGSDDVEVVTDLETEVDSGHLYPNPTTSRVKVRVPGNVTSWTVTTIDGRRVDGLTYSDNTLDFGDILSGVYLLKLVLDNGKSLNKRIVKH